MTVRKRDQSEHRFSTLDVILKMYNHTTTVIANEKIFDRTYSKLIDEIDFYAKDIYHNCRVANESLDNRIKEEAEMRIKLETKAINECEWLKTDIMLAQKKFHLRASKVIYWKKLVDNSKNSIMSWRAGEKKRYKENFGA